MARRAAATSSRTLKILAWSVGSLVALAVVALLIGQVLLNRYLRSPAFREKLEAKSGQGFRAQVGIAPIRFEGAQFFCDNLEALGIEDAAFSQAKIEDVRGSVALPSIIAVVFGDRTPRVEAIEVQRLALDFYRERLPISLPPREKSATNIGAITVRDTRIGWPGGGIAGATARITPAEGGWRIEGGGGKLSHLGLPSLDLTSARLVWKDPILYIQDVKLRHDGGEASITGEFIPREKADLHVTFNNVNVAPLLPQWWLSRLHGRLTGEARVQLSLREMAATGQVRPIVTGKVRMENGVVEALPVLNQIADYLKTEQFRRLQLNLASADAHYDGDALHVTNLILEARQLLALRGSADYAAGRLDSTFDLGVTPGPLRWLPATVEQIFATPGSGYAWTKVRVTGPWGDLKDDLSPRLTRAIGAAVIEKIPAKAVESAVEIGKKGVETLLEIPFRR
jgi:AsmA-like C-terminal region